MSIQHYEYNDRIIEFEHVNGQIMANATAMCQAFGKRPAKWLELESTKRYMIALGSVSGKTTPWFETRSGGSNGGGATWIHEKLILKLAQWLDVRFEIWCDQRIAELLRTGRVELKPMSIEEMMIAQLQAQIQTKKELAEIRQEMKEIAAKAAFK